MCIRDRPSVRYCQRRPKQHHRYQRHRAGAGELCGPYSGPLARRPGTWRPHTAPRPRLAGQNRRHRVGTLDGAPGLAEGGLGGAGWLGCPPRAVRQASGVGETISGRRGGGSEPDRVGRPIRLLAGGRRRLRDFGRPRRLQPGRAAPAGSWGRRAVGPTPYGSRGGLSRGVKVGRVSVCGLRTGSGREPAGPAEAVCPSTVDPVMA